MAFTDLKAPLRSDGWTPLRSGLGVQLTQGYALKPCL